MIKTIVKGALGLGLAAALVGSVGAANAQAAVMWEHSNYQGVNFGADHAPNVGSLNDRGSSLQVFGRCIRVYEDAGFQGRTAVTCHDINALSGWNANLHWYDSWNDRISSWVTQ